jgi:hypothetical protein
MTADDPITLAVYAQKDNLLDTPGWKCSVIVLQILQGNEIKSDAWSINSMSQRGNGLMVPSLNLAYKYLTMSRKHM